MVYLILLEIATIFIDDELQFPFRANEHLVFSQIISIHRFLRLFFSPKLLSLWKLIKIFDVTLIFHLYGIRGLNNRKKFSEDIYPRGIYMLNILNQGCYLIIYNLMYFLVCLEILKQP